MPDSQKSVTISYHDLKELINDVLDERDSLDRETHHMHHEAMNVWLENQRRKDELVKQAVNSAIGIVVVSTFGALAWVGKIVIQSLHISGGQ